VGRIADYCADDVPFFTLIKREQLSLVSVFYFQLKFS